MHPQRNLLRYCFSYPPGDCGIGALIAAYIEGLAVRLADDLFTRGFTALHDGNDFGIQPVLDVAFNVVYTFASGTVMYVTLRVAGNPSSRYCSTRAPTRDGYCSPAASTSPA